MALTKRDLGLSYLAATGVVFSGILLVSAASALNTNEITLVGTTSGLVLSLTLATSRVWLPRFRLEGDQLWEVAKWGGLGIGLLTLVYTLVHLSSHVLVTGDYLESSLLISNVAAGGVIGVLVGCLWELHKTNRWLTQKHTVMNRVLRHDIRNDMNMIRSHLELLEADLPADYAHRIEPLTQKVDDVVLLSDNARKIPSMVERGDRGSIRRVDLVPAIEDSREFYIGAYPEAVIETDLPASAPVYADDMVSTVVDNVLENALVHHDGTPEVAVSVSTVEGAEEPRVQVRVVDDGPGIPEAEIEVLSNERETALEHSSGLGLWLVQWLVAYYDGEFDIDNRDGGGTEVTIELPKAP